MYNGESKQLTAVYEQTYNADRTGSRALYFYSDTIRWNLYVSTCNKCENNAPIKVFLERGSRGITQRN